MRRVLLIFLAAAAAFAAFGFFSALQDPVVVRYRIALPGLARPVRIVQLSDSHASAIDMRPARLARVVAQINALHPDLVALTGDYISGDPDDWDAGRTAAALAPFKALHAPLGVYAVLGNHDDAAKTAAALLTGPVRLLVGEGLKLAPFCLAGIDDLARGTPAVLGMKALINACPPGRPLVMLAHEPTFFAWRGVRPLLMITGHTHGGQILLPLLDPWTSDSFLASHRRGVYHDARRTLLVSSGLGTSIVPLRFRVPPEIVEISLVPAPWDYSVGRKSGTDR